ncbi:ubiquinone/menaquinone biosynthesis C-methylase UbiE [Methanolinea mesophila]|uniref:class I SAM-dependent methyltransferase n=1 Tax=Methanolinea mesophila TaxID=547055 RepID=UPI001AE54103|nr:methyltransferase domain-containing protein [Methanolinea mesophila]MBP1929274.1 ubiquinone/menaquinone biosynthesis C-methylase UbiE [Methanolinea mesophila]
MQHNYHDEEGRRRWQNPEELLVRIGLEEGDTFMDVGCGEGFFAIPAARIVGRKGKVFGIDVNRSALDRLEARARSSGLDNITVLEGEGEEVVPCAGCADFVFFGIDLHDFRDPGTVIRNAGTMLIPGKGRLVDLDWKKVQMSFGPPYKIRLSPEQAKSLITEQGFDIMSCEDSGPWHYLIIARLP